jgi:hypothetical protein
MHSRPLYGRLLYLYCGHRMGAVSEQSGQRTDPIKGGAGVWKTRERSQCVAKLEM